METEHQETVTGQSICVKLKFYRKSNYGRLSKLVGGPDIIGKKGAVVSYIGVQFLIQQKIIWLNQVPIKWLYKFHTKLECFSLALWLAVILQQLLSTLNLMMRSFKTEKVKMELSKPSAGSSLLG